MVKFSKIKNSYIYYKTPSNLTYWWNFGVLSLYFLILQVLTGLLLVMFYDPNIIYPYSSIMFINNEIYYKWLIRGLHANGASFFFLCVYIHIFRGVYYNSFLYPRQLLCKSGVFRSFFMLMLMVSRRLFKWKCFFFLLMVITTSLLSLISTFLLNELLHNSLYYCILDVCASWNSNVDVGNNGEIFFDVSRNIVKFIYKDSRLDWHSESELGDEDECEGGEDDIDKGSNEKPNFLIGFNIFNFVYHYVQQKEQGCAFKGEIGDSEQLFLLWYTNDNFIAQNSYIGGGFYEPKNRRCVVTSILKKNDKLLLEIITQFVAYNSSNVFLSDDSCKDVELRQVNEYIVSNFLPNKILANNNKQIYIPTAAEQDYFIELAEDIFFHFKPFFNHQRQYHKHLTLNAFISKFNCLLTESMPTIMGYFIFKYWNLNYEVFRNWSKIKKTRNFAIRVKFSKKRNISTTIKNANKKKA